MKPCPKCGNICTCLCKVDYGAQTRKSAQRVEVGSSAWMDALRETKDRILSARMSYCDKTGNNPPGCDEVMTQIVNAMRLTESASTKRKAGAHSLHRLVRCPYPASRGRLDQAKRFALSNFDKWNDVTGFVAPHTGYYYELCSIIEDGVEFGFGVAHNQSFKTIVRRVRASNDQAHGSAPALKHSSKKPYALENTTKPTKYENR